MKTPWAHALKARPIVDILAALMGIGRSSRAKLEAALQAPSTMPVVGFLVRLRLGRLIRKATRQLATNIPGLVRNEGADAGSPAGEGQARHDQGTPGESDSGRIVALPAVSQEGSFPKVIFQTWKSKIVIPFNYAQWSDSFKRLNPGFEYVLWDDLDNRNFIEKYYPWFLPIYDAYPREIFRADAVRYFFLYQFGGLYVDMDTECLRPVAPLFESGDVWLGRMGYDVDFPHSIPNAIMASRPRQEFWLLAIHLLVRNASEPVDPEAMPNRGPEAMTGPIVLKRAYDIYTSSEQGVIHDMIQSIASRLPSHLQPRAGTSRVVLLEPEIWYPVDWSNVIHLRLVSEISSSQLMLDQRTKRRLFPTSYLVTYWSHSWKAPTRK